MTDPTRRPLGSIALYNPHLLSKEELVGLFVARRSLLDRLLEAIAASPPGQPPQHHLLVGQRGMGKTMLLRRLRYALEDDPELSLGWLPLTFPEEQYNVARLSDFCLNCVDALSDALETQGGHEAAQALDGEAEELRTLAEDERAPASLALLIRGATDAGRRLVLLVDNVDLVFERMKAQGWALREILSQESALLLIGASSELIETTYKYDQPFYDFFQVHELKGLSADETRQLLAHYAGVWKTPSVARVLDEDPGRIHTLHTLTGGNPRTVALLHDVLARGLDGDIRRDLESLLDHCTPLYKARLEALPPQAQQVLHALAVHWHPASAGELAEDLQLDVNAVSSQLNRLVRQGVVEKVSYDPATKTGFQLAERFFNIWYLMRVTRRARRKLLWLVEFLRIFYSREQLLGHARRHLAGLVRLETGGERLRHAEYSFALADALGEAAWRSTLEIAGLQTLMADDSLRSRLGEVLDLEGTEAQLKSRAEHQERLQALRRRVLSTEVKQEGWNAEDFWQSLAGSPLRPEEKARIAASLDSLKASDVAHITTALEGSLSDLAAFHDSDEVAEQLGEALRSGGMMDLDDLDGARYLQETSGGKGLLPVALGEQLGRSEAPEPSLLDELRDLLPDTSSPGVRLQWCEAAVRAGRGRAEIDLVLEDLCRRELHHPDLLLELGGLLWRLGGKADLRAAERAVRRSLELGADSASAWYNLGLLLGRQRGRTGEEESAYRKALAIEPGLAGAWINLGVLLAGQAGRGAEAEAAYRKALAIRPSDALAWYNLGLLLGRQADRAGEAEAAFRKALELRPRHADTWNNLGALLAKQADRAGEAEAAFGKALEIEAGLARAWNNLGAVLADQAGRAGEAEAAFRKALGIQTGYAGAWNNLGILLGEQPDRSDDAEAACRQALQVKPGHAGANNLAWVLFKRNRSLEEAETLGRQAVELDPGNPYLAHTLAMILLRRGKWAQAAESARRFLTGTSEQFLEESWQDILAFFTEAVAQGNAREATLLLDDLDLAERWLPLREALEAAARGSRTYLRRVAPEVRQAAEEILDSFPSAAEPSAGRGSDSKKRGASTPSTLA